MSWLLKRIRSNLQQEHTSLLEMILTRWPKARVPRQGCCLIVIRQTRPHRPPCKRSPEMGQGLRQVVRNDGSDALSRKSGVLNRQGGVRGLQNPLRRQHLARGLQNPPTTLHLPPSHLTMTQIYGISVPPFSEFSSPVWMENTGGTETISPRFPRRTKILHITRLDPSSKKLFELRSGTC